MKKQEKIEQYIAKDWYNNKGEKMIIISYISYSNVVVEFENGYITKTSMSHIKEGRVKNMFYKLVCGVGFLGEGKYDSKHKSKRYWANMLHRCYNKKIHKERPTYKGCSVDDQWHNFQNFAEWFDENNNPETMKDFVLDKDILIKNSKSYSSKTCCFVPQEINGLFTKTSAKRGKYPIGVIKEGNKFRAEISYKKKSTYLGAFNTIEEAFQAYKTAKEVLIKKVADKWKGKITEQVYEAMYNYQVEITD